MLSSYDPSGIISSMLGGSKKKGPIPEPEIGYTPPPPTLVEPPKAKALQAYRSRMAYKQGKPAETAKQTARPAEPSQSEDNVYVPAGSDQYEQLINEIVAAAQQSNNEDCALGESFLDSDRPQHPALIDNQSKIIPLASEAARVVQSLRSGEWRHDGSYQVSLFVLSHLLWDDGAGDRVGKTGEMARILQGEGLVEVLSSEQSGSGLTCVRLTAQGRQLADQILSPLNPPHVDAS